MPLFQRMQGFREIFAFLGKFKTEHVSKVIAAFSVISDENAKLEDKVKAGLAAAAVLAEYTPTEADDDLVRSITKLAARDDLWSLIETVVRMFQGESVSDVFDLDANNPHGIQLTGRDESEYIPWPVIIQLVSILISWLRERRNNR